MKVFKAIAQLKPPAAQIRRCLKNWICSTRLPMYEGYPKNMFYLFWYHFISLYLIRVWTVAHKHLPGRPRFCQDSRFWCDFVQNVLSFERINTLTFKTSLYFLLITRSSRAGHFTSSFIKQKTAILSRLMLFAQFH